MHLSKNKGETNFLNPIRRITRSFGKTAVADEETSVLKHGTIEAAGAI
jgi:hypothetical protein